MEEGGAMPGSAGEAPVNILVVDDLPEKLVIYKTILEELGQNIITARGGEEALKKVLAHEFAVILLDVNMPGMDGFETATLIRRRRKSAGTPIIFLTAFTDEQHVTQGYASGAVDYLLTPVIPEVLRAKVRVFIELSQVRRQAAVQAEERARRKAAEEADRRKDEFLGMLAHELRNPLGPIRSAVYLLQAADATGERAGQLRDIINRQVSHMSRLIDDLLDSTRLARGQILLRQERCDIAGIVQETVNDYFSTFETDGIRLSVRVPPRPVWVDCDPTRVTQMVGNLLHNAQKFTNAGGEVFVELAETAGQAEISVRDTGIGIDPATLPWIFDAFRQGEQGLDRKKGGLGLGLALVKGLAQLHEGTVSASSAGPGRGTTVTIRLPAREGAAPAAADSGAVREDGRKWRILLIEDNADTAETTAQLLSSEGHEVHVAHNGPDGLALAARLHPRVVLCDIGLPDLDGYQVARALRGNPASSGLYLIALTGYGRDEDLRAARKAGFDAHLTKPVDYGALRRVFAGIPQGADNEKAA